MNVVPVEIHSIVGFDFGDDQSGDDSSDPNPNLPKALVRATFQDVIKMTPEFDDTCWVLENDFFCCAAGDSPDPEEDPYNMGEHDLEEAIPNLEQLKATFLRQVDAFKSAFVNKIDGRVTDIRRRLAEMDAEEPSGAAAVDDAAASGAPAAASGAAVSGGRCAAGRERQPWSGSLGAVGGCSGPCGKRRGTWSGSGSVNVHIMRCEFIYIQYQCLCIGMLSRDV